MASKTTTNHPRQRPRPQKQPEGDPFRVGFEALLVEHIQLLKQVYPGNWKKKLFNLKLQLLNVVSKSGAKETTNARKRT